MKHDHDHHAMKPKDPPPEASNESKHDHHEMKPTVSIPEIVAVTILSFVLLGAGIGWGLQKATSP